MTKEEISFRKEKSEDYITLYLNKFTCDICGISEERESIYRTWNDGSMPLFWTRFSDGEKIACKKCSEERQKVFHSPEYINTRNLLRVILDLFDEDYGYSDYPSKVIPSEFEEINLLIDKIENLIMEHRIQTNVSS